MAILKLTIICVIILFLQSSTINQPDRSKLISKEPINIEPQTIDMSQLFEPDEQDIDEPIQWQWPEPYAKDPLDNLNQNMYRVAFEDMFKSDPFQDNLFTDVGDVVLLPPEIILDQIIALFGLFRDRSGHYTWTKDQKSSVLSRIFDIYDQPSRDHLFSIMLNNAIKKEQKFFSRFGDSYLDTPNFEDGTEEIDQDALASEQRKVLWDIAKDTYISKYKFKIDDRIRDEAFYFSDWRGADFVVLPPLVAGYLWYRGLDKKYKFNGLELHLSVEPIGNLYNHDNELFGVGMELAPKDWPVKLIVAGGLEDGDPELQFIGIGTNFGIAKKAFNMQQE